MSAAREHCCILSVSNLKEDKYEKRNVARLAANNDDVDLLKYMVEDVGVENLNYNGMLELASQTNKAQVFRYLLQKIGADNANNVEVQYFLNKALESDSGDVVTYLVISLGAANPEEILQYAFRNDKRNTAASLGSFLYPPREN